MLPTPPTTRSEILLLCDSAKLARAIELALRADGHFETLLVDPPGPWPISRNNWDLILIAFSTPFADPLVLLRQAGLIQWVGHWPILIITPHPFTSQPNERIWYLEFPFEAQTLSNRVAEILSATSVRL
jgi:hypothetical protein